MLSRVPTPTVSQSGARDGGLIGGGVRPAVQVHMEGHTHHPGESSDPDEGVGRQEEETCSHLPGWTARVALQKGHPHQRRY